MARDKELDRRKFLQIGGQGLLVVAAGRIFGQAIQASHLGRKLPANKLTLKSRSLEVVLDGTDGLPHEFRLLAQKTRFCGGQSGEPMTARICDKAQWKLIPVPLRVESARNSAAQANFHFTAKVDGKPAASFTIRYLLQDATVTITMYDVQERMGFELIEVAMPSLVTVREEDGAAWLAHGDTGGSLAMLNQAKAGSLSPNRFWGKTLATLPVVMVGNGKAVCVQEVTAFMDGTELSVSGTAGHRRASLGTIKAHRVDGSQCFDMNTGNDATTKNCGNRNTPNLLIGQQSSCRLDFIADAHGDGSADWLDGAQFVRQRMPPIPKHIYDDAFTYGILCDQPLFDKPTATFEDCERIIRDVSALTDNAKQIVHLWGWQYKGKDTGYPAVAEVNNRIGGHEGMIRLMQRAKEFNCATRDYLS